MLNSESMDCFSSNDYDTKSQVQGNIKKYHSILPDLATGWRPKNAKIAAPIFITYEDELNELALKTGLTSLNKLIYIGPRHDNSYKFHSLTDHRYNVKYGIKCDEVPFKLKKQLEQFTIKSNNRKGLFSGMNPSTEKQLQFQSNFESGNLDLVVKGAATEYNLFLRPDTNTRGHMQWFYFKINNQKYPFQKVKINICNNRKAGVLFNRGMKPYVYSKYVEKTRGIKWQQAGQNIQYKKLSEKQGFFISDQQKKNQLLSKYYCLSFEYKFQHPDDEVSFAYCPPYTYSQMRSHLNDLKKKSTPQSGLTIKQQNLCTSLTGLQIPIITITNQLVEQSEKKYIIATGRFHPGQSNGSYVIKGFMDFLVSQEAEYLREKIVFKVVPMVNPDGVVFGNYRNSLSGQDLNRKFKSKNIQLIPQVANLKNFVLKLKKQQKMNIMYYLDFHGHSIKKNVFLYGPQYDIWSTKFQRAKILPKIIASKTNMFRYQSCLFRVAPTKKSTARAFMLGLIPYCYTIQSSVGLYRVFQEKEKGNVGFDAEKFQEMGRIIGESLRDTWIKIQKQNKNILKKKKKTFHPDMIESNKQNPQKYIRQSTNKQLPPASNQHIKSIQRSSEPIIHVTQDQKQKPKPIKTIKIKQKQQNQLENQQQIDEKVTKSIKRSSSSKSITRDREVKEKCFSPSSKTIKNQNQSVNQSVNQSQSQNHKLTFLGSQFGEIQEVQGESDGYSQGKSDCESDDNDFDKERYGKISGKIIKFIENFNISVIGERRKDFRLRNKKKVCSANKNRYFIGLRKTSNQEMGMVPSLKHKVAKREFSQKKITTDDRQDSILKSKKLSIHRFEDKANKV